MRLIKKHNGYTVVETLMVVAVTGMLFIATSLMISGQLQRTQFKNSMQLLEQSINSVIDNVNNGTFTTQVGADGTSERLHIGTQFWFCADSSPSTECSSNNNGNIMHVESVITKLGGGLNYEADNTLFLANGLKFSGYKNISSLPISGLGTLDFGASLLYFKPNGDAVTGVDDSVAGIGFFQKSGGSAIDKLSAGGVLLCFTDGGRWGSIELPSSGVAITMRLEDKTRCV